MDIKKKSCRIKAVPYQTSGYMPGGALQTIPYVFYQILSSPGIVMEGTVDAAGHSQMEKDRQILKAEDRPTHPMLSCKLAQDSDVRQYY